MKKLTDMLSQNDFDTLRQIIREEVRSETKDMREDIAEMKVEISEINTELKKHLGFILSTNAIVTDLQVDMKEVKAQLVQHSNILSYHREYMETTRLTNGRAMMSFQSDLMELKEKCDR